MTNEEIIQAAYFAIAHSLSPSLTKAQQEEELGRCWKILSEGVGRIRLELEVAPS